MPDKRPNVAVHTISLRGYAGAIFVLLVIALVFFSIGYATPNWSIHENNGTDVHQGLWETCSCNVHDQHEDWFIAFKVLMTVGLVCLGICIFLICLYMCVHAVSKNSTIKSLVAFCFISVVVMLAAYILYGVKQDQLNWSFALSVIGCFFTLLAGVFSVMQMRDSGVSI